jgi:hypothetical protein
MQPNSDKKQVINGALMNVAPSAYQTSFPSSVKE